MTKSKVLPYAVMFFIVILWGLSFLSIKVTVEVLEPMTLAFSRFTIASILLLALLKLIEPGTKLQKRDIPMMAISGFVGITIYFFFENTGVKLTTASTASIIIGTIPMLTVAADYIFCGNKINFAKALGIILAFSGVYLIVSDSSQPGFSSGSFLGNLLMLGAAVSWVIYSLATRPLSARYSLLAITTYQTLLGTIGIFPFVFTEEVKWNLVDVFIIANVVFLGVFCSAVGYYSYVYAIEKLGVTVSALFINLVPLVTVISSYFILGEKITSTQMIGGGIILFAVYLADMNSWFKTISVKEISSEVKKT